ncbi:MAG: hypothetical protein HOB79_11800 [Rhodospirillaceae bacterium]|jgi:hypothetical protein|nr:hypothetical protein [Rhodospirillales bacterium]MBT3905583.1 hypothetical protein [Rhodospirillaceae bacterium]MBT4701742.1 hypothetical protein [Rhodospirillaceae bacterium]MBT5033812.1 hypothetical protein [Rhodospirillaceae bacterium]MBT6220779.1 hypothetical protein [Rhodospirillaceae bacterium]
MTLTFPILIAIALVLGACTEKIRWEHPGLPTAQWDVDKSTCKNAAVLKVNSDIAIGRGFSARDNDLQHDQYAYQMARYEGLRRQKKLTEACMVKKGYQKVKAIDKKK